MINRRKNRKVGARMLNILKKSLLVILCAQLAMPPQILSVISMAWAQDQTTSETNRTTIPIGSPASPQSAVQHQNDIEEVMNNNPKSQAPQTAPANKDMKIVLTVKESGAPENDQFVEALKKRVLEAYRKSVKDRMKLIDDLARKIHDPATSKEEKNAASKEREKLIREEYLELPAVQKALINLEGIASSITKFPKLWGINFDASGNAKITCTITEGAITFNDENGETLSMDNKDHKISTYGPNREFIALDKIPAQISITGTPIKKIIEAAVLPDPTTVFSPKNRALFKESVEEMKSFIGSAKELAEKVYSKILDLMKTQATEPTEIPAAVTPEETENPISANDWLTQFPLWAMAETGAWLNSDSPNQLAGTLAEAFLKMIVNTPPADSTVPTSVAEQPNPPLVESLRDLGIDPSKERLEAEKIQAQRDLEAAEAKLKELQSSVLKNDQEMLAAKKKFDEAQAAFETANKNFEEASTATAQARLAISKQPLTSETYVPFLDGNTYQYTDPTNPKNKVLGTHFFVPDSTKKTEAETQSKNTSLLVGSLAFSQAIQEGVATYSEDYAQKWGSEFRKSMEAFKKIADDMALHPEKYPPLKSGDKVVVLVDSSGKFVFKNSHGATLAEIPPVPGGSKNLQSDLNNVLGKKNKNFATDYADPGKKISSILVPYSIKEKYEQQLKKDKAAKIDSGAVFDKGVIERSTVEQSSLAAIGSGEFKKALDAAKKALTEADASLEASAKKHFETRESIENATDAVVAAKEKIESVKNELALAGERDSSKRAELVIEQKIKKAEAEMEYESNQIARLKEELEVIKAMDSLQSPQAQLNELMDKETELKAERERLIQQNQNLEADIKRHEEENRLLSKEFNEIDPKKIVNPIIVPDPKKGLDYIDKAKLEYITKEESAALNEMDPDTGDATKTSILFGPKESPKEMRAKIKSGKITQAEYAARLERAHRLLQDEIDIFRAKKQIETNEKKVYEELIPQLNSVLKKEVPLRDQAVESEKQRAKMEEDLKKAESNLAIHQRTLETANAEKASFEAEKRSTELENIKETASKTAEEAADAAADAAAIYVDAEIAAVNARIAAEKAQMDAAKAKADYDAMVKKEDPASNRLDTRIKKAETDGDALASAFFKAKKTYDAASTSANKAALDAANAKVTANTKLQKELNDKRLALDASKTKMDALKAAANAAEAIKRTTNDALVLAKISSERADSTKIQKHKDATEAIQAAKTAKEAAAREAKKLEEAQRIIDETKEKIDASLAVKAEEQYHQLKTEADLAREKANQASQEAARLLVLSETSQAEVEAAKAKQLSADANKNEALKKYDIAKAAYDLAVKNKNSKTTIDSLKDEYNKTQTAYNNARIYAGDLAVETARVVLAADRAKADADYARTIASQLTKDSAEAVSKAEAAKGKSQTANDATTPEAKAAVILEAAQKAAAKKAVDEAAQRAAEEAAQKAATEAAKQAAIDAKEAADMQKRLVMIAKLVEEVTRIVNEERKIFEKQRIAFNNYLKSTPNQKRPGGLQGVNQVKELDLTDITQKALNRAIRSLNPSLTDEEQLKNSILAIRSKTVEEIGRQVRDDPDNRQMAYSQYAQEMFEIGPAAFKKQADERERHRREVVAMLAQAEKEAAKAAKAEKAAKAKSELAAAPSSGNPVSNTTSSGNPTTVTPKPGTTPTSEPTVQVTTTSKPNTPTTTQPNPSPSSDPISSPSPQPTTYIFQNGKTG